ncbi:MAG: hypothetical protein KDB88_11610 [Flavobacteriales bacterium]|nr:hypothetical protein [Flavobacteriales bacterium]
MIGCSILVAGCKKDAPEEPTIIDQPPPPPPVFSLGDTTGMVITSFGTTYSPSGTNQWYSYPIAIAGLGSTIYLDLYRSSSLGQGFSSSIKLRKIPGSDVQFNGAFKVDTTFRNVDSVLTFTGLGSHPYTLTLNVTTGCDVTGTVHSTKGRFEPIFFDTGDPVDIALYASVDTIIDWWSGNSWNSPAPTFVNDSTIRETYTQNFGDCFVLPPPGQVFHIAFSRFVQGVLKQGWLTLERPSGSGWVTVHYAAFEP